MKRAYIPAAALLLAATFAALVSVDSGGITSAVARADDTDANEPVASDAPDLMPAPDDVEPIGVAIEPPSNPRASAASPADDLPEILPPPASETTMPVVAPPAGFQRPRSSYRTQPAAPPRDQFLAPPRRASTLEKVQSANKHTPQPVASNFAIEESSDTSLGEAPASDAADKKPALPASAAREAVKRAVASSGVTLNWSAPQTVVLGQEVSCELTVHNGSDSPAANVRVEVPLSKSFAAGQCDPAPEADAEKLVWNLGALPAGEAKTLHVGLAFREKGHAAPHATVTCTRSAAADIEVVEPKLELKVAGSDHAVVGQPSTYYFRVTNTGTGAASNVVLAVQLAEGMQHAQGQNPRYRIGTLEAGESRQVQVPVTCLEEGARSIAGVAMIGEIEAAAADQAISAVRPTLEVAVEGPKLRYVERKAAYVIKVQNPGPAPLENVQLTESIPEGFRFVEASSGGSFDRSARQVAWFVGRLEPNESASVGVELIATELGDHRLNAAAKADDGVTGKAEALTRVEGVPSLALEVNEDDDPIEAASETCYHIRITNRGTKPASGVQVAADVPAEMEVLKLGGPAVGVVKGQQVVFPPLAKLEPGQSEEYQVRVKCLEAGQVRFRAYFRSDDTPQPVMEEEHTRVYAD